MLTPAIDDAQQRFVFRICRRCCERLDRLPIHLQTRQLLLAISELERHPDRYDVVFFDTAIEATLFCRLEAERLRGLAGLR